MLEKLPAQVPVRQDLPLPLHFRHKPENLIFLHSMLDFCVRITDDVIPVRRYPTDPVHDVLPILPPIKNHIPLLQRAVRLPEIDIIPPVHQKRGHTIPCQQHTDFLPLLCQLLQDRKVGIDINNLFLHFLKLLQPLSTVEDIPRHTDNYIRISWNMPRIPPKASPHTGHRHSFWCNWCTPGQA